MTVRLLPRSRVNYTWKRLVGSLFVREKSVYCKRLKRLLAQYFGVADVVLTSSGRNSLFLLLSYLHHKKVIVPSYTCKAVTEAALMAGKQVVYVEVSLEDFNILPEKLVHLVDDDSIVIATHQYGNPCRIEEICDICRKAGALVIEDCAASLGTVYNGKLTGLFGNYAFFSFDSTKLVTVPSKGGFIIAADAAELHAIEQHVIECRIPGIRFRLKHTVIGMIYLVLRNKIIYRIFHYVTMQRKGKAQLDDKHALNLVPDDYYRYRMAAWQAYMAIPQIEILPELIERRKMMYHYYDEHIRNTRVLRKPVVCSEACCIKYAILVKDKKRFYDACLEKGVDMAFSFSYTVCPRSCEHASDIAAEVLNIPFYWGLREKDMERVVSIINWLAAEIGR